MIDTYLLEQLTAVYECGTLSAASEKLHLTQPTLTRSMQKLEDIIGVKLFERTKNRVHLNENLYMVSVVRQGIKEWRKATARKLISLKSTRFSGRPVPADLANTSQEGRHVQNHPE